ncbi:MAG: acyl carrier protein [Actinobacteria bacterium]|nr:acyl carrier protein [Actinomycetota bacterium]
MKGEEMEDTKLYDALSEVLVTRLKVDADQITPAADLFEDLGLDSIDMMTAVMAIEEQFGIEVSDKEVEGVRTLQEAVDLLTQKVTARA